jgi:exopolyphosphatase/guanosine-5'-triphosphate,3'-diphosphate pyrophosphatase
MNPTVAVIDIGSNSIKSLVARRQSTGELVTLHQGIEETRISTGISRHPVELNANAIHEGALAVERLWNAMQPFGPFTNCSIVATSAVREAVNRADFAKAIEALTGQKLGVLSGDEEAMGIATGVQEDPALRGKSNDFSLFDQGGGSMEWICVENNEVVHRLSMPLGAVRLTEKFIADKNEPIPESETEAIIAETQNWLQSLPVPIRPPVIACGGGVAVIQAILNPPGSKNADAAFIPRDPIEALGRKLCGLTVADRIRLCCIPASRADILPATLLVFQTILRRAGADGLRHSTYNLRYGIAVQKLSESQNS